MEGRLRPKACVCWRGRKLALCQARSLLYRARGIQGKGGREGEEYRQREGGAGHRETTNIGLVSKSPRVSGWLCLLIVLGEWFLCVCVLCDVLLFKPTGLA